MTSFIYKQLKRGIIMDWLYGLGALLLGGTSILFYVEQIFIISLITFVLAILFVYLFEIS